MRESDGFDGFDWETGTAAAWRAFQARLADRLAGLADDEVVLLEAETSTEDDGAPPYVQIWAARSRLRGEAVSNDHLAASHRLVEAAESRLLELGFSPPASVVLGDDAGPSNFRVDAPREEADRLARMAVAALRDVYGVPHPAFLTGDALVDPAHGPGCLQRLVDEAMTSFFGHPPEHDEDGDIPVPADDVTAYVSVLPERAVVRVLACLASGIKDSVRADREIGVLNRDVPFLTLFRRGEGIFLKVDLLGRPFVPDHLVHLVELVCRDVGRIRDDLVARLATTEETPHPAMLTLLHLDAQEPGSVDARLAASICEHDRDLVLQLLDWNAQQEDAWRDAHDDAEAAGALDLAAVCQGSLEQAARTRALLQGALRVVVERPAAPLPAPRSPHRSESGRGDSGRSGSGWPGRPWQRSVPDPTLEEVDPGMWG